MSRLHIQIPSQHPKAVITIPVRITDINYGNHLGNDAIVSIIHESRMQFFNEHGFTELDAGGTSLIISDLAVSYKNESFYGDKLQIEIYASDISRVSFELLYKISTIRNDQTLLISIAKTTMVCFNYEIKKVTAVTEELKQILL